MTMQNTKDMQTHTQLLAAHFRKCRAEEIGDYLRAEFPVHRQSARDKALHYGRLTRKLEGQA